jgi:DNA polymerase-3 subunit gamma/tau
MRDALSLLDQGIAFGGGRVEAGLINQMLGSIDRDHVLRLLTALSSADGQALLSEVDRLDELAPDYAAVLDDLLAALQRLAVLQLVEGRSIDEEYAELQPFADSIAAEDVQLYYQIALHGRRDLPVCRDPRMGFEMTLLRMLAFRPEDSGSEVERAAAVPPPRASRSRAPRASAPGSVGAARLLSPTVADGGRPAASPARMLPANGAGGNGHENAANAEIDWPALLQTLEVRGPARQLADHCDLVAYSGRAMQLVLPPDKSHLNTHQLRARLETALKEHFGRDLKLTIASGAPTRPTPAEIRKSTDDERMRAARESIAADPNVKALQAAFDATVEADSVRSTKS